MKKKIYSSRNYVGQITAFAPILNRIEMMEHIRINCMKIHVHKTPLKKEGREKRKGHKGNIMNIIIHKYIY